MALDFSRCRSVQLIDGTLSPPPPHVKIGVETIVKHPFFLLADDMGGMKTAQAIISTQFLSEAGVINKVIVIAPASVRPVWFDQDLGQLAEQLWLGKRNIVTEFHHRDRGWIHEYKGNNELYWIITNYEYISRESNRETLEGECGPKTMLILDESSAVKGYSSKQTEACMIIRQRCGRVLLLNGTPVADSPLDMFSQGNIMHPSILKCRFITHFRARYANMSPILGAGGKPLTNKWNKPVLGITGWHDLEDLQKRFAPYVLRREAKSLGIDFALPPVALTVTLTKETWKIYKSMRDEMVAWLQSGNVAVANFAASKAMRLAQITNGFIGGVEDGSIGNDPLEDGFLESLDLGLKDEVLGNLDLANAKERSGLELLQPQIQSVQEIGREKLDFTLAWHAELLERYPDMKLLSWCRFVPQLRKYLSEVQRFGHPVGAVCGQSMLGGRVKDERAAAVRLLHPKTAPAGPVTVGGTFGTGALGLNFTACRTVLDMSYDFSPWKKAQSDARVNRTGQTGPVSFFYLVAVGPRGEKTIDHHIIMSRLGKLDVNNWTASAWVKALMEE